MCMQGLMIVLGGILINIGDSDEKPQSANLEKDRETRFWSRSSTHPKQSFFCFLIFDIFGRVKNSNCKGGDVTTDAKEAILLVGGMKGE